VGAVVESGDRARDGAAWLLARAAGELVAAAAPGPPVAHDRFGGDLSIN
jgi:hypothetical protein